MCVDKSRLLMRRLPEGELEIEGVGAIRVRGLARGEVLRLRKSQLDQEAFERTLVALCMVDPPLTEDEVAQWQDSALSDELEDVVDKIKELSALNSGADKEAYKSSPDES
jgi:hypothetical protein